MTMRPGPYEHLRADATFDALEALEGLAADRGTSGAALAIAWLLGDRRVTAVVVGPRRPEHLEPALVAFEHPVTAAERDELARLFAR
jgi:aryl-alcohol dehydrogenase-like predicted oxidoreductase